MVSGMMSHLMMENPLESSINTTQGLLSFMSTATKQINTFIGSPQLNVNHRERRQRPKRALEHSTKTVNSKPGDLHCPKRINRKRKSQEKMADESIALTKQTILDIELALKDLCNQDSLNLTDLTESFISPINLDMSSLVEESVSTEDSRDSAQRLHEQACQYNSSSLVMPTYPSECTRSSNFDNTNCSKSMTRRAPFNEYCMYSSDDEIVQSPASNIDSLCEATTPDFDDLVNCYMIDDFLSPHELTTLLVGA